MRPVMHRVVRGHHGLHFRRREWHDIGMVLDPPPDPWHGIDRLLCLRIDNMGDVLMTQPALRALRERFPGTTITLLTSRSGATIAPLLPEVDEVIRFPGSRPTEAMRSNG
jgi:hypothetical protein